MNFFKVLRLCLCAILCACLMVRATSAMELSDNDWLRLNAGDVVVQSRKVDGKRRVEAAIVIKQTIGDIWRVMLDCAAAPEFVPNMRRCEVLDRADDGRWEIIEHEVKYSWLAPKTIYQFKAEYVPQQTIHFERISGDLKHLVGDWRLDSNDDLGGAVLVSYSVYIDPGFIVPGFMVRRSLRKDLPDVMRALRHRVAEMRGDEMASDVE